MTAGEVSNIFARLWHLLDVVGMERVVAVRRGFAVFFSVGVMSGNSAWERSEAVSSPLLECEK